METYTNVTVQVLQSAAKVRCRRLEGTASWERCILCEKTVWTEKSYSAFEYKPQFEVSDPETLCLCPRARGSNRDLVNEN